MWWHPMAWCPYQFLLRSVTRFKTWNGRTQKGITDGNDISYAYFSTSFNRKHDWKNNKDILFPRMFTTFCVCNSVLGTYMERPCPKNGRRKMTHNSIEVDAETKESTRKTEETWMEGIRKAMNERNLNEGQWEDRKQWSLGVGQRRTTFWNRHTYIHTYIHTILHWWQ